MKRMSVLVPCLLGLITTGAMAQSLDSALAYFPMDVGNVWEYANYSAFAGPPSLIGYGFVAVTGDTLLPCGHAYRVFTYTGSIWMPLTGSRFYRVDSATANVYCPEADTGREFLWDSLRANLHDGTAQGEVESVAPDTILGIPTLTKRSAFTGKSLDLSLGYGVTYLYNDDMFIIHTSRLVYAKIGGKAYGTLMGVGLDERSIPKNAALLQNYPNPFNPSTTIRYELPKSSMVRLSVYDILGREVSVLVNERKNVGSYEVKFDGKNLATGVYFYRLQAGDFTQTKRLLLLK